MPSKLQLDENLVFLYICLQNSDYKSIDFNAVGDMADLKAPAARMRYTRLAKAIESGTLIGKKNTSSQGVPESPNEASKKRKKTAFDSEDDEEGSQKTLLGRGRQASGAGSLYEGLKGRKNALGDKVDGSPAAKKRTKLTKTKAAAEDNKAENISAGTRINGPKPAKSKISPFTAAKAFQDTDLPPGTKSPAFPDPTSEDVSPSSINK